jgi:hypothetical protein
LNEVLVSLGFEAPPEEANVPRRQEVLDDLAAGRLSATEAAERLRAIGAGDEL